MDLAIAFLILALVASVLGMARFFDLFGRVSIIGTLFITLFLMHGASAVPYSLGLLERDLLASRDVPTSFPLALGISFLCFTIGSVAAARLLRFDLEASQRSFLGRPMAQRLPAPGRYLAMCLVAVALGLLFAFGAGRTGVELFAESARNGAGLREFRMGFYGANPYFYMGSYARNLLVPFAMLAALNVGASRRSRGWQLMGWSLFLFLLVISLANLHKLPVIEAFLYVLLNRFFRSTGGGRASLRPVVLAGAAVLVLGTGLYYLTYELAAGDALYSTLYRVTVIPQQCFEGFLRVYPDIVGFNHGLGIGLVARLLGTQEYLSPPFLVGEIVTGVRGVSANSFWSSEFWAAFGYAGVVVGSMAVGALLVVLERWVLRRGRTPVSVAAYSYLVVAAIGVPSVSIFTSLLSGGIGLAPLAVLLLERHSSQRASVAAPVSLPRPS